MGMAASQARYLSLSARKTNTEYEGQQLNQQRLNLANQTADLFNQMLGMSVPSCPDSNDFTKLQYSWSDGINDEVISDFYQIAVPNEEFNYVVTSYRYEDVYTGQSHKMNLPEIQASKTNNYSDNPDKTYSVRQMAYHKESLAGAGDDSYTILVNKDGVESTHVFKRVTSGVDDVEALDQMTKRTTKAVAGDMAHFVSGTKANTQGNDVVVSPNTWSFDADYELQVRRPAPELDKSGYTINAAGTAYTHTPADPSKPDIPKDVFEKSYDSKIDMGPTNMPFYYEKNKITAGTTFDEINFEDESQRTQIEQLLATYGDKYDPKKSYYAVAIGTSMTDGTNAAGDTIKMEKWNAYNADGTAATPPAYYLYNGSYYNGTTATDANLASIPAGVTLSRDLTDAVHDAAGDPIYAFICGDDMDAASGSQGEVAKVEIRAGDKTIYYTDGVSILSGEELSGIDLTDVDESAWVDNLIFHSVENNPMYSNYTAVGNMDLNSISVETYNGNEDMQIEIKQVMKDMQAAGNDISFGNLSACFDSVTGEYMGGIYSFKMYGHTYYTTTTDLESAVKGAYAETALASNGIDSQNKLTYYTSSYISTKVEESKRAMLESDGKGRFTSVKFEGDDTVYTLKCETVTDDEAYQNAMNQYFYKQEQYDKGIADINARTEVIQAEDRELQLRLEQLGTEQTALQTEMEACQKVVSKSIESSFKTFGG